MRFGVFLNQYYAPGFEFSDLIEQSELMEQLGFDSATVGERHVHEEGFVEPITALGALAARTETLDLGTAALVPILFDPLRLAEQTAMIDRISNGRMHFGAALGYREKELASFDAPNEDRVGAFLESLSLLKRLWNEERVTHDGDHYSYEDVCVSPRPSEMPVWIGGHADIAIKRAAYRGDAWIASASSTTEDLEHQIAHYEDCLEEFGMDRDENDVILMRDCYVADGAKAAREAIEPHLIQLYEWYAKWGQTYVDENEIEIEFDTLDEKGVFGSPAAVTEQFGIYEELGVDHVVLRVQFPGQSQESALRCLERLGEEVLPAFQ